MLHVRWPTDRQRRSVGERRVRTVSSQTNLPWEILGQATMAAAVGELLQRRLVPVDNDTSTLKITSQPASNILSTFSLQCIPSAMNTQPIDQVFTARCTLVQSAVLRSHVVCPSVCLSVTLRYCDYIGWKSSKIISWLVSLGCSLFAIPTSRGYSKGNTPKFLPE